MSKISINDDKIEINGKIYVPENSQKSPNYKGKIRIVILQRGWIYIGRYSKNPEIEGESKLENAFGIQSWGTTKGLCELVNGPTNKTILNKCEGTIYFNDLTVIHTISVKEEKWPEI